MNHKNSEISSLKCLKKGWKPLPLIFVYYQDHLQGQGIQIYFCLKKWITFFIIKITTSKPFTSSVSLLEIISYSTKLATHNKDKHFSILLKAKSDFYLSILESVFVTKL